MTGVSSYMLVLNQCKTTVYYQTVLKLYLTLLYIVL